MLTLREQCNGWIRRKEEFCLSRIINCHFLACKHSSAWKTAQGTVSEKDRREYVFEKRDFRNCILKYDTSRKEITRDLSPCVYCVHCNYNLYLFVIDTFIGRLLLLVASVISQAQISETGENRARHFLFAGSSHPILITSAQLIFFDFPLFFIRYIVIVATGLSYKMFIES